MRRSITKATMGGNQSKTVVRYESEFCEPGTQKARMEQMRLLRTLAETPELQNCGYFAFQKMNMRHTGEVWVIELEAVGSE
jgi:hypothetical protein